MRANSRLIKQSKLLVRADIQ